MNDIFKRTVSQCISSDYAQGWNDCIDFISSYNPLVAQKSIKLSDLFKKLLNEKPKRVLEMRERHGAIYILPEENPYYDWWICIGKPNDSDKNIIIEIDMPHNPKWLFALWLCETEIILDIQV